MTVVLKNRIAHDGGTFITLDGIKCDRCLVIYKPRAKASKDWGAELNDAGWVARMRNGKYRHACRKCSTQFLIDHDHGIRLF